MFFLILPFLVLFVLLAIAFYRHALEHSRYWRHRGTPGPPSRPFFGNLDDIFGQKLGVLQLREWTKRYGPVYGIQQGWTNILVCSNVEMLNELFSRKFHHFHGRKNTPLLGNVDTNPQVGMFSARGQRWKRLRAIATPAFSVNSLKRILPILNDSSRKMMDFMDEAHERAEPFNIHPHFHELTMDMICRVAMGQKDSRQFQTENVKMAKRIMARVGNNPVDYIAWIFPRFWRLIRFVAFTTWRLRDEPFRKYMVQIEAEVRRRKMERDEENEKEEGEEKRPAAVDFIDLFLEAETDEPIEPEGGGGGDDGRGGGKTFQRANTKIWRRMSIHEVVSQCILFLLAGFDTTANTLAITCWYLAHHPQVQTKLQCEIDTICGTDEEINYEQLNRLKYSEAVMREVLRLQPIAANVISRVCAETTTLGEWIVEQGTVVQPDLFSIHLDERLWGSDAAEFRPERWFDDPSSSSSSSSPGRMIASAWLPFGAGPRICLGMRLAQLEQKMALVHLLSKYSVAKCAGTESELKLTGQGVFNPESVTVKLEKRNI